MLTEMQQMVEYINQLKSNEVSLLLDNYNAGSLKRHYFIEGGNANSSFYVQTGSGEFVLTFFNSKTFEEVKGLVDLLRHLEDNSFPTSRVILSNDGRYTLNYNGRPAILKKYIRGTVIQDLPGTHLWQLGKQMAFLHGIPPLQPMIDWHDSGLETFDEVFDYDHIFVPWLKNKKRFLTANISNALPRGLIHGDVFYDNVIVYRDLVKAIIDFETGCNYFFTFDLGMCMVGTCMEDGQLMVNKAKSLLEGYHSIRALSPLEKDSLKLFVEYGAVATASWRFRQYHILSKDENLKNRYLEMKRIADNIHAIPNEDFIKLFFKFEKLGKIFWSVKAFK
jgi:homoserine kinase type II